MMKKQILAAALSLVFTHCALADSTLAGTNASASDAGGTALGEDTIASDVATAVGSQAAATGSGSTAIGVATQASGQKSLAAGYGATAGKLGSALGAESAASGDSSAALGYRASAAGFESTAVGSYASAAGRMGTAIGTFSSVADGADYSLALGYQSVATRAYTVSVGNATQKRQITNLAAGTDDFDAVNLSQLKDTLTKANQYTDQKLLDAVSTANSYTDNAISNIDNSSSGGETDPVSLDPAYVYTDKQVGIEAQARVEGDARTLQSANSYSDTGDTRTLQSANSYSDAGDARTLKSANTYTDNKFAELGKSVNRLSDRVDQNQKRADAGISGAMAMTAIPMVEGRRVSFGMAMAGYHDQGAVAAGLGIRTSDRSAVKINTSWNAQNGAGVAAGFALGW